MHGVNAGRGIGLRIIVRPITVAALTLLTTAWAVHAQSHATDRGSWLIDGSASLTKTTRDGDAFESNSTQFRFTPSVQYFLLPGLGLGLTLNYSISDNSIIADTFDSNATVTVTGLGPTVSYYLGSDGQTVLPFVTGSYLFERWKAEGEGADGEQTTNALEGALGVLFLLTDHVGLTAEGFVETATIEDQDGTEADRTLAGLRVGIAAFVF